MATFTADVPLNMRWFGNEINGAVGATHRINDALYEEFNTAFAGRIPGFAWIAINEATGDVHPEYLTRTLGEGGTVHSHGNVGATETIDATLGNIHLLTLDANCTLTLAATTSGPMCTLEIYLTQDSTGSRTVTWPGSVTWPSNAEPVLSTTGGAIDRVLLETYNGGTTWYGSTVGGSVAGDVIWDAAGDLIQGLSANRGQKLTAGTAGMVLKSAGTSTANLCAYPPGYEYSYVADIDGATITATAESTSQVLVTAGSVTYDGTPVMVHAFAPFWQPNPTAGPIIVLVLWDNTAGASIGKLAVSAGESTSNAYAVLSAWHRFTPAAGARVYSIRAFVSGGTGTIYAGAGGVGNYVPAFIRITKV